MQKDHLLLCAASFTDIEINHPPENKSYWVRIVVDGKTTFESQKRDPGSSTSWKEKKEFFSFLPTSTFELFLVRTAWRHPKSGRIIGRLIGMPGKIIDLLDQSKVIQLEDLHGGALSTTIAINFSLETNVAQIVMDNIEKDLARIGQSKMGDPAIQDSVVDTFGNCIEPLGKALQAMTKIMDSVADVHPILKVSWNVLSSVYKAVKAQGILDEKMRDLSDALNEMLFVAKTVPNLLVVEGTENVVDEIGKAALDVATLMSEYTESSSLAERTMKYQLSDSMTDRIGNCQNRCKLLQEKFDRRMQMGVARDVENIQGVVDRIDVREVLGDLAYVKDGSWALEQCCLAGTREEPIERIMAWIEEADPSNSAEVLVIEGVAGSGKSALANSIGRRCHEKGVLKTSFFFQRDSAELSTAVKFVSTLALDLSSHGPFAKQVRDIIDKERGLASKFSYRQFEELIVKPSTLLPLDKPLVVIIDALDECAERLDVLLKVLRDGVRQLPGMFRFLVTSRPTLELDEHLSGQPHVVHQSLDLNEQSNLEDIDRYVSHSVVEIFKGKEPDAALVKAFSMASEGLFIWASTILIYIRGAFNQEAALRRILDENRAKQLPTDTKMNQLYISIMDRLDWNDPDFLEAYLVVMGMVLTAREPLPISVLVSLNQALSLDIVTHVLGRLRAVLYYSPQEPIRVLHKSFHDFLVTCSPDQPYYLSIADHEHQMAAFCLDILNQALKEPITGTDYLADKDLLPRGIWHIPDDSISDELWYSCRFWISHCISIPVPLPALSAALQKLISVNFVHWIEICASKGSFTGVDHSFMTWLKSILPDMQEMLYSTSHLAALQYLSLRLRYDDRRNEALLVMQPVMEQYQQLAATDPATFSADYAGSLGDFSLCLLFMGRREEALNVAQQAVDLYKQLCTTNPAAFNADLAQFLIIHSACLSEMGHREKALDTIQQAVELYKHCAMSNPATFDADLASCLHNYSINLAKMGHYEEALDVGQEVVKLYKQHTTTNPAASKYDLAASLTSHSSHLSHLGHQKEALDVIQQALKLYQELATTNAAAFNSDLADCLQGYSELLSDMDNKEAALSAIQQAVELHKKLAATNPAAFSSAAARSLVDYARCLSHMGHQEEALDGVQQAVTFFQHLAINDPAAFNANIAIYLYRLDEMSGQEEALDAILPIKQAIELGQQLAITNPAAFNAALANSLNHYVQVSPK